MMDHSSETDYVLGSRLNLKQKTPAFVYLVTVLSSLGGFLFGYDMGAVSGGMKTIRGVFGLNDVWQQLIVSVTIAGAWAFSLVAGPLCDRLGRKTVIILASFISASGSVLMGLSNTKEALLIGRFIVGAGVGLASVAVPLYVAEVSPTSVRGRLVTLNQSFISLGKLVASIVVGSLSTTDTNAWRFILGLAGVPAAVQFASFLFLPESPRWLIQKSRYQESVSVLRRIRGPTADTEKEFEAVKKKCMEAERETPIRPSSSCPVFWRIVDCTNVKRALMVGCLLQVFQQLSGVNTVMHYSSTIIEMSGLKIYSRAIWLTAALAGVHVASNIMGIYFVEKTGRRMLTLVSLGGAAIGLLVLALGFHLNFLFSPNVLLTKSSSANITECTVFSSCLSCTGNAACGYCFQQPRSSHHYSNSSLCLPREREDVDFSSVGSCAKALGTDHSVDPSFSWAYDWCPSSYTWIILIGFLLYLVCFTPGMGLTPWTINSEIYPIWARSTCYSVSSSINWFLNLVTSVTILFFTGALSKFGVFYLYAALALLGWVVFYYTLPETRGETLEEAEALFTHPRWQDATTTTEEKVVQYVHIKGINRSTLNDDADSGDDS